MTADDYAHNAIMHCQKMATESGGMACGLCIAAEIREAEADARRRALEEVANLVRDFRERNWRAGRVVLNGRHDRDDAIVDAIFALAEKAP